MTGSTWNRPWMLACGLALVAGCTTSETDDRIVVSQRNELGITALDVNNFTEGDNNVFEIRGYDASNVEQVVVRVRRGTIPELSTEIWGADDTGTEVTVSLAGQDAPVSRAVTRSRAAIEIDPID